MGRTKKETTVFELEEFIRKFCEERDWDQFHSPKELTIGMVTEASELLEHFRFKSDQEMTELLSDPAQREKVMFELADVFFFVLRFAQMNRIDLGEALLKKTKHNAERYPLEKARGSNRKYNE